MQRLGVEVSRGGVNGSQQVIEVRQTPDDDLTRRGFSFVDGRWVLSTGVNDHGVGARKVGFPVEIIPGQPMVVASGPGSVEFADGVMMRVVVLGAN